MNPNLEAIQEDMANIITGARKITEHLQKWAIVPEALADLLLKTKNDILIVSEVLKLRIHLTPT